MDHCDVYQLRAKEYERSFYSLRGVEWKLLYQVLAGYVLIATAWWNTRYALPCSAFFPMGCSILTIMLCVGYLHYSLKLSERLHRTRDLQNTYLEMLHAEVNAELIPAPPLRGERWYAFYVQQIFSFSVMVCIVWFINSTK